MTAPMRRAERRDLAQVETLLKQADLPALEAQVPLSNLLVAEDERQVVGAIALEVFGRSGLVRAVVVAPERRGQGLGRELCRSLLARASELGLREIYAVPSDAVGFFTALGFEPVGEEEIAPALRRSRAFRRRGPDGAPVLRLALA